MSSERAESHERDKEVVLSRQTRIARPLRRATMAWHRTITWRSNSPVVAALVMPLVLLAALVFGVLLLALLLGTAVLVVLAAMFSALRRGNTPRP